MLLWAIGWGEKERITKKIKPLIIPSPRGAFWRDLRRPQYKTFMVEVAVPFAFPLTLMHQYFLVSKIFLNRILVIFLNYIVKFLLDIYFKFFFT